MQFNDLEDHLRHNNPDILDLWLRHDRHPATFLDPGSPGGRRTTPTQRMKFLSACADTDHVTELLQAYFDRVGGDPAEAASPLRAVLCELLLHVLNESAEQQLPLGADDSGNMHSWLPYLIDRSPRIRQVPGDVQMHVWMWLCAASYIITCWWKIQWSQYPVDPPSRSD